MTNFISCDWGTSRCRVRLVDRNSLHILSETSNNQGIAEIAKINGDFGDVLEETIGSLEGTAEEDIVVISGMASSTIGIKELPYARTPFSLSGENVHSEKLTLGKRNVLLISGLATSNDIMRGEETELIGLFDLNYLTSDCIVIMPGTHVKHVEVADGKVKTFHTAMTGELYTLAAQHSIIQHSVTSTESFKEEAFIAGLNCAKEFGFSSALFKVRTRQVLDGSDKEENASFLSGICIGSDLKDLTEKHSTKTPLLIYAGNEMSKRYIIACHYLGFDIINTIDREFQERAVVYGQKTILNLFEKDA